MRYGKAFISLFTAALVAVAGVMGLVEFRNHRAIPISVTVESQQGTEEIPCWENEWGEYYVFLPSYASLSQTYVNAKAVGSLTLAGNPVTQGDSLTEFCEDTSYTLTHSFLAWDEDYTVTFLRSANIPALYLNVKSGSMDYIHESKEHQESGTMRLYTAEGVLDYSGGVSKIETRGNSTWSSAKKPYNLDLSEDTDLLGMGAAKRWILLANAQDETQLHNKIVYEAAREVGLAYSPESRWVDLYLNGNYAGLYLLCERNEVHAQRVDLDPDTSFLVSKERKSRLDMAGKPYVYTAGEVVLRIRYSSMEEDALLAILQSAENAILSPDGIDPNTGKHLEELLDLDSWVKKYLIEEVFGNIDGDKLSQYFYYDGTDGKLYAGPVWDYDRSMGNPLVIQQECPNQFFANRPGILESPWYHALCGKEVFWQQAAKVYEETFLPVLRELLAGGIREYQEFIADAAQMNAVRWNAWNTAEQTQAMQTYMEQRVAFLTRLWVDQEPFYQVIAKGYGNEKNCYLVSPGGEAPQLMNYDYRDNIKIDGWYYQDTDIPFDPTKPITENTEIQLRYRKIKAREQEVDSELASPLRYGPAVIFVGMLALVCIIGMYQTKRSGANKDERSKQRKISP